MIKVERLTKTYKTQKTECEALRGVSFVLPETGMVFILGKSGSGKSTLLNLLGGLDAITDGDIIVDGKKYADFTVKDFDNFRNEKLGFIFQDFCLIDELTIEENVRLVMDLQTRDDYALISSVFESVGLEGLESRYPKELSAGQKQRVAIARAIVKNPKIILADEPTGNIDSKTAAAVLDILKEMSAERLVVVISHNTDDAAKYGDRIIELADGEIIRDETREKNYVGDLEIDLPDIVLPYNKKMTADEIKSLNTAVRKSRGEVYIDQRDSGFTETVQPENVGTLGEYHSKGMRFKRLLSYAARLSKKRWLSAVLTVVIISFLMIVFGMAQLFTTFDGSAQIDENVSKYGDNGLILRQGYYDEDGVDTDLKKTDIKELSDENIAEIEKVYNGKTYKMYTVGTIINDKTRYIESYRNFTGNLLKKGYITETNGTLICDIDYLKHLFGDADGNLNVLAGEIKEDGPGVIITDYIADALMYTSPLHEFTSYDDIIAEKIICARIKVDAIIDTDYEQKYEGLFRSFMEDAKIDYYDDTTLSYIEDALNYLSVCFSLNDNFWEDYISYCEECAEHYFMHAYMGESTFATDAAETTNTTVVYMGNWIGDDDIRLSVKIFNELFDTDYRESQIEELNKNHPEAFEGKTVSIVLHDKVKGTEVLRGTFNVTGLYEYGTVMSGKYVRLLRGGNIVVSTLYTENSVGAMDVIEAAEGLDMYAAGYRIGLILKIVNIVKIFDDIFFYIGIALCAIIVTILVLNSVNNIKQNSYQIGVIRAMGGRTGQLTGMFALHTVATGLLICILTIAGSRLGVMLFNNVLLESMTELLKAPGIGEVTILVFNPAVVAVDVGIILLLTVITVVVPLLAVRRVQPIKIIRSRE